MRGRKIYFKLTIDAGLEVLRAQAAGQVGDAGFFVQRCRNGFLAVAEQAPKGGGELLGGFLLVSPHVRISLFQGDIGQR